jgi:hypothetical protein
MQAKVPSVHYQTDKKVSKSLRHPRSPILGQTFSRDKHTFVNMATICEPATEGNDGDLETSSPEEAVLHRREVFGLRHGDERWDN